MSNIYCIWKKDETDIYFHRIIKKMIKYKITLSSIFQVVSTHIVGLVATSLFLCLIINKWDRNYLLFSVLFLVVWVLFLFYIGIVPLLIIYNHYRYAKSTSLTIDYEKGTVRYKTKEVVKEFRVSDVHFIEKYYTSRYSPRLYKIFTINEDVIILPSILGAHFEEEFKNVKRQIYPSKPWDLFLK